MTLLETPPQFTRDQKAACAEREVKQRKRVYARFVDAGKMSGAKADYEIACMEAIAADYRAERHGGDGLEAAQEVPAERTTAAAREDEAGTFPPDRRKK